jgi:recombination protein RecT
MSNAALARATGTAVATTAKDSVAAMLEKMKPQMALALPKHINAERMARIVLTEIRRVPKLGDCGRDSLLGAVMTCSQLGLEPGNGLGHAYLLPFDKRAKVGNQWQTVGTDCQLIIGYRGMIDLARRSGQIVSLSARAVCEKDMFNYRFGLDETIEHVPADGERGNLTHVYAVAKLKDGGVQFEVLSRAEIEKVRAGSKAKDNGPWVTHFEEMAKKTAIRRLFKYLPVSIEMQRAVTIDEQGEAGIRQDHNVIDMETGEYTGGPLHIEGDGGADAGAIDQGAGLAPTYAEVLDGMLKAKSIEVLDLAADLIASVADAGQRKELSAKYDALRGELVASAV